MDKRPLRNLGALSDDEIAIYKAALLQWGTREKHPFNLAVQTYPLRVFSGPFDIPCECLKDIDADALAIVLHSVHRLTPNLLPRRNIRLVDTDAGEEQIAHNDPEKTMGIGMSVHDAVTNAINNGMFSFSEIVFDGKHQHALLSYSFHCGMLCGSGMTLVFEKVNGKWRRAKIECGGWVS